MLEFKYFFHNYVKINKLRKASGISLFLLAKKIVIEIKKPVQDILSPERVNYIILFLLLT